MEWLILAQSEPLSGGAGWVGAGLLGAVLFWLLVIHLPNKDKQIDRMNEQKDKLCEGKDRQIAEQRAELLASLAELRKDFLSAMGKQTDQFAATVAAQQRDYREALQQALKHCEDEVGTMANGMHDAVAMMAASVKETLDHTVTAARDAIRAFQNHGAPGTRG